MSINNLTLEQIWQALRPHLEWAAGFNLAILFADQAAPVNALRELYGDSLHLRTLRLRVLKPTNAAQLADLAKEMLKNRVGYGPLWVELWQPMAEPDWDRQRAKFLHQLNENRSKLERNLHQPVVLVLPVAERLAVSIHAPDLWSVRSYTVQLPAPAPSHPKLIVPPSDAVKSLTEVVSAPSLAQQEWARLLQRNPNTEGLDLWDGFAAVGAALERGSLTDARRIANETLAIARQRVQSNTNATAKPENLRDLSVSLNKVGDAEQALGNLEPARTAFRESLEIRRQLRQAFPHHAQFKTDLDWVEARWAALESGFRQSLPE